MFRERDRTVRIHLTPAGGTKTEWNRKVSEITPGSLVGLKTDEGDLVKINVTTNDAGNFTGSVYQVLPNPPRSRRLAVLGADAEVAFSEKHLRFVFSVPAPPSE